MEKKENLHKDHRKRLKEKYITYGHEVLSDHEFLELLLFFSVPFKNTNELAHQLLNEFGSFSQLIEADYDTLRNLGINDMKDNSACLLKVVLDCISRYNREKNDITKTRLLRKISAFLQKISFMDIMRRFPMHFCLTGTAM